MVLTYRMNIGTRGVALRLCLCKGRCQMWLLMMCGACWNLSRDLILASYESHFVRLCCKRYMGTHVNTDDHLKPIILQLEYITSSLTAYFVAVNHILNHILHKKGNKVKVCFVFPNFYCTFYSITQSKVTHYR